MPLKICLSLLTVIGLLLGARVANACSCNGTYTVLSSYQGASVVVVAMAVAVEKAEPGEGYEGIVSTKMIVEKVFKGDLKIGDEMTFGQGSNIDCIWGFYKPVGQRFLFYLGPPDKISHMWYVAGCGRSRGIQDAGDLTDDLLYLNKLEEVRGKTRISGTLQFANGADMSVEGRTIRIVGSGRSYEVKTNRNGVYEIYDLPAGKYLIEPETPAGWKWLETDPMLIISEIIDHRQGRSPEQMTVNLADQGHASFDISYEKQR